MNVDRINTDIAHLKDYRSPTHPNLNRVLVFWMNFYLTKRLLNESKIKKHKRKSLVYVYRICNFYTALARDTQNPNDLRYAKKGIIFSDQKNEFTVEQMIRLIGDYFDRWDLEIKVVKNAKLSKIKNNIQNILVEQKI